MRATSDARLPTSSLRICRLTSWSSRKILITLEADIHAGGGRRDRRLSLVLPQRNKGHQPIERPLIPARRARHALRDRALPDAEGPSMAITGGFIRRFAGTAEEIRECLRHALRIVDAYRHAAERDKREARAIRDRRRYRSLHQSAASRE